MLPPLVIGALGSSLNIISAHNTIKFGAGQENYGCGNHPVSTGDLISHCSCSPSAKVGLLRLEG